MNQNEPEKHCPRCKGPINWKLVRDGFGSPLYNGLCPVCNIVLRGREAPAVTKGRQLAKDFPALHGLDKEIMRLPGDVQLGFLRERQKFLGRKEVEI